MPCNGAASIKKRFITRRRERKVLWSRCCFDKRSLGCRDGRDVCVWTRICLDISLRRLSDVWAPFYALAFSRHLKTGEEISEKLAESERPREKGDSIDGRYGVMHAKKQFHLEKLHALSSRGIYSREKGDFLLLLFLLSPLAAGRGAWPGLVLCLFRVVSQEEICFSRSSLFFRLLCSTRLSVTHSEPLPITAPNYFFSFFFFFALSSCSLVVLRSPRSPAAPFPVLFFSRSPCSLRDLLFPRRRGTLLFFPSFFSLQADVSWCARASFPSLRRRVLFFSPFSTLRGVGKIKQLQGSKEEKFLRIVMFLTGGGAAGARA